MSSSWLHRLWSWLSGDSPERRDLSFDPATFEQVCEEDPTVARELLRADQRDLVREFEKTYRVYHERLEQLSLQLAHASSSKQAHDLSVMHEAQDAFRQALRRLETSAKTARQLERELADWQAVAERSLHHSGGDKLHADHPKIRLEMTRSELALRQARVERKKQAESEQRISIDPEHLLIAIQMSIQEAERWHAVAQPDEEALYQVHDVKQLNGLLKQHDRLQGIRRDRLNLAIRMRDEESVRH